MTRVCQMAWKTGEVPNQWQTSVLIPINRKGGKKSALTAGVFFCLPGKVYAKGVVVSAGYLNGLNLA